MTDAPPSAEDYARLERQNAELHEQVKHLVRLDRRLFRYQHEADRQIARIESINRFALAVGNTTDPNAILELGLRLVSSLYPLEQAAGLLCAPHGLLTRVVTYAVPGHATSAVERGAAEVTLDTSSVGEAPRVFSEPQTTSDPVAAEIAQALHATFGTAPADVPSAVYLVLPLLGHRNDVLGALVLRKLDPELISYHDTLPTEEDNLFLLLMSSHVASALQNAILHQELMAFAEDLEQRVLERTAELDQMGRAMEANTTELRQTRDQLLHASKMVAVGTLVAGLSHELNNPITVILGFAQGLLRRMEEDDPHLKALEAIERQARRCADLVAALLDFSRTQPLARTTCTVTPLLERVYRLAQTHTHPKGISLELVIDDALPRLYVCITEIESALLNLVNNAIDASEHDSAVVLCAEPSEVQGKRGVSITVRDVGKGIPAHRLNRIFDPFFTTKPVGQGTGLGLSLTRKIIESHDGVIRVNSAVDEGTTMEIWLPAAPRDQLPEETLTT